MDTGEWIAIAVGFVTILLAIFGMGLVLIQKMDNGDARTEERSERRSERLENKIDRVDARVDEVKTEVKTELKAEIAEVKTELKAETAEVKTELKAEIAASDARSEARSALVIAELRSFRESVENRMNGMEREQARQEGVLSVLVQRDRGAGDDRESSEG